MNTLETFENSRACKYINFSSHINRVQLLFSLLGKGLLNMAFLIRYRFKQLRVRDIIVDDRNWSWTFSFGKSCCTPDMICNYENHDQNHQNQTQRNK